MTDVSMLGALLAGLVSFLSRVFYYCARLRLDAFGNRDGTVEQGQQPRVVHSDCSELLLRQNRGLLAPVAGALILLLGLHLLGWLPKLS